MAVLPWFLNLFASDFAHSGDMIGNEGTGGTRLCL